MVTRHIGPPPLIGAATHHSFDPLAGQFLNLKGSGDFTFQPPSSLAEVGRTSAAKMVLTRPEKATTAGFWLVPKDRKGPIPQFVSETAFDATNRGEAFLLMGCDERASRRVVVAIARLLSPSVGRA